MSPYLYSILIYAGINVTLAVSLNLVTGITGQFSIGHAGFMAVGAYVSAFLTTTWFHTTAGSIPFGLGVPVLFAVALYAGGIAAALAGVIVGLPSLRLKGDYLAIVTLGFGEIIRVLILNIDAVGGARGMTGVPPWTNCLWVAGCALLCVVTIKRLLASPYGRALLAIREDEIAAEAMGVNSTRSKVAAFVVGAFFAGVAGGLYAHMLTFLSPQAFDFNRSFEILIMVVLGGMGSTAGAVVAALLLTGAREALRPLQELTKLDFRMVIYAALLIILMLARPEGLFGGFRRSRRKPSEAPLT